MISNETDEAENTVVRTVGKAVGKTEKLLTLIINNPYITLEELAKEMGLTVKGVEYHITKLKENKSIIRKGGRKEGYWIAIDNNNNIEDTVEKTVVKTVGKAEELLTLIINNPHITQDELVKKWD